MLLRDVLRFNWSQKLEYQFSFLFGEGGRDNSGVSSYMI